jgi:hypothetical protein
MISPVTPPPGAGGAVDGELQTLDGVQTFPEEMDAQRPNND